MFACLMATSRCDHVAHTETGRCRRAHTHDDTAQAREHRHSLRARARALASRCVARCSCDCRSCTCDSVFASGCAVARAPAVARVRAGRVHACVDSGIEYQHRCMHVGEQASWLARSHSCSCVFVLAQLGAHLYSCSVRSLRGSSHGDIVHVFVFAHPICRCGFIPLKVALDVLAKCFSKDQMEAWSPKLKEMIESYGTKLSDNPALFKSIHTKTATALNIK